MFSIPDFLFEEHEDHDHWRCAECGREILNSDEAIWSESKYICVECAQEEISYE